MCPDSSFWYAFLAVNPRPEWRKWALGEEEAIEQIKFACASLQLNLELEPRQNSLWVSVSKTAFRPLTQDCQEHSVTTVWLTNVMTDILGNHTWQGYQTIESSL